MHGDGPWTWQMLDRRRAVVQPTADVVAWSVALIFGALLRYDFHGARVPWAGLGCAMLLAAALPALARNLDVTRHGDELVGLLRDLCAQPAASTVGSK